MARSNQIRRTGWLFVVLGVVVTVLLFLLPPERTLGSVIKIVFLHGALVRVGLIGFVAAGMLGIGYLILLRESVLKWCLAVQQTTLALWVVYILSSMLATRLSWGQWIAWGEPRVQASFQVLGFAFISLALVRWVNQPVFTGVVNAILGVVPWFLVRRAAIVLHPFNPIGTSNSLAYQVIYGGMVAAMLGIAFLIVWWVVRSKFVTERE